MAALSLGNKNTVFYGRWVKQCYSDVSKKLRWIGGEIDFFKRQLNDEMD